MPKKKKEKKVEKERTEYDTNDDDRHASCAACGF